MEIYILVPEECENTKQPIKYQVEFKIPKYIICKQF